MPLELCWERPLHQSLNSSSVRLWKRYVIFTEGLFKSGTGRLSCVDIISGEEIWTSHVSDPWGWVEVLDDTVYYLAQRGSLVCIDAETGAVLRSYKNLGWPQGYLIPTPDALITGGWRGYTDLRALDPDTLEEKWKVAVRSRDIQRFAVPKPLPGNTLLLAHHTKKIVELRDTGTGRVLQQYDLTEDFRCPDLDHSCQIVAGMATFFSEIGRLMMIDHVSGQRRIMKLNIEDARTSLPSIDDTRIVYADGSGKYCLYDRLKDQISWKVPIENNIRTRAFAAFLNSDCLLLGGSMGQLKLVDGLGRQRGKVRSYRRIGTEFLRHDSFVIFGAKSELVAMRWSTSS